MLAIGEIWGNFRDDGGDSTSAPKRSRESWAWSSSVFEYGQADGSLGEFDPRVMAVTVKAALDALLNQLATDPELDLEAYGAELVRLFEQRDPKESRHECAL